MKSKEVRQRVVTGKGCKWRKDTNFRRFWNNFDDIDFSKKESRKDEQPTTDR